MQLRLTVTAAGADLLARRRDGIEHSRWPIAETDPLAELERLDQGPSTEPAGPHLVSLGALDAAVDRQGYRRLTDWTPGP